MHLYQTTIINGQRHAKRGLRTYAKSVDSDQPPRLRRRVWPESELFDTHHINSTDISCCVSNWITCSCIQYCIGADRGLHYLVKKFTLWIVVCCVCCNSCMIFISPFYIYLTNIYLYILHLNSLIPLNRHPYRYIF